MRDGVLYNVEQFDVYSNAAVKAILLKAAQGVLTYLDVKQLFKFTLGEDIPNPRCEDVGDDCKLKLIIDNVDTAVAIAMRIAGIEQPSFRNRLSNSIRDKVYLTWLNVPAVCQ